MSYLMSLGGLCKGAGLDCSHQEVEAVVDTFSIYLVLAKDQSFIASGIELEEGFDIILRLT